MAPLPANESHNREAALYGSKDEDTAGLRFAAAFSGRARGDHRRPRCRQPKRSRIPENAPQ